MSPEGEQPLPRARDGAKEPAPGEANPLAEHEPGQRDRRTSVWGSERGLEDGWSDTS